jgi:hypothetical protein
VYTRGPNREQVVAAVGEQRGLSMRVARQHSPIGDGGEWNAQGEIGSGEFDWSSLMLSPAAALQTPSSEVNGPCKGEPRRGVAVPCAI